MGSTERRLQRIGGGCGLLFLITLYVGFLTDSGDVDAATATRAEVADFMSQHATNVFSRFMIGISVLFLVWFIAALVERIRSTAGRGMLTTTALGGGLLWAGLILVGSAGYLSTQFPQLRELSEETATALWAVQLAPGLTMGLAQVMVYTSVAVASFAARALPRWLGWVSALVAIATAVGMVDPFATSGAVAVATMVGWLLGLVWLIATSVVLMRRAPAPTVVPISNQSPAGEPAVADHA